MAAVSSVVKPRRAGLMSVTRSTRGSLIASAMPRWNGKSRTRPGNALVPIGQSQFVLDPIRQPQPRRRGEHGERAPTDINRIGKG